jgi:hypothetical protein
MNVGISELYDSADLHWRGVAVSRVNTSRSSRQHVVPRVASGFLFGRLWVQVPARRCTADSPVSPFLVHFSLLNHILCLSPPSFRCGCSMKLGVIRHPQTDVSFLHGVLTGSRTHRASCALGTDRVQSGRHPGHPLVCLRSPIRAHDLVLS